MPSVLFRADAERSIGTGDLMSLLYLSAEFRKNAWECLFMVRAYEPALRILKCRSRENVFLIPHNASLDNEIALIRKVCGEEKIDCLFMEVTKHNLLEYKELGRPSRIKACANFDGIITDDFDIVVNWCVDRSDEAYEAYAHSGTRFILGFEKSVLPDHFDWGRISARPVRKNVEKILISMGGVDEFNLTKRILGALSSEGDRYEVRVIAGPGYADRENLISFSKDTFRGFTCKDNTEDILEDYLWADAAFSAGGLTSTELVAAQTPAVLIAAYEHQAKRCEHYGRNGWALYLGFYSTLTEKKITDSMDDLASGIGKFAENLRRLRLRGGNEEIFEAVSSR